MYFEELYYTSRTLVCPVTDLNIGSPSVTGLSILDRNRARSMQQNFSLFTEIFCQILGGLVVIY